MLELGTLPSENIRNVCNLSELNDAKFERNLMLFFYSCRIVELTNFGLASLESFQKRQTYPSEVLEVTENLFEGKNPQVNYVLRNSNTF